MLNYMPSAPLFVILFLGGWSGPQIFPTEILPGYTGEKIYNAVTVNAAFLVHHKDFGYDYVVTSSKRYQS